ncbi:MAG: hypothetical protein NC131_18845, partial [Roseburia sp.]|nr:hypothetical protein [Roseburia sp.]
VAAHVSAEIFLTLNQFLYIYTKDNYLYKYDRNWEKVETINIKNNGYDGCFERAYVTGDKIVFYAEDPWEDISDVYIYDVPACKLQKTIVPKAETKSVEDTDIIQWDGDIYYMLCYYEDGDLYDSTTRTECAENGIYRLDVENKRFVKVSDRVGHSFLILNNELNVTVDYFFGLSYRVRTVDPNR